MLKVWARPSRAYTPPEDGRWINRSHDCVQKNAKTCRHMSPYDEDRPEKQLFADQEAYAKEGNDGLRFSTPIGLTGQNRDVEK